MLRFVIPVVLPLALQWVRRHETQVLCAGMRLNARQTEIARAVGVREPQRVRVRPVSRVPALLPGGLFWARPLLRWWLRDVSGMAFGHGVYIRSDHWDDQRLWAHELTHVAQYERYTPRGFLRRYLIECLRDGYAGSALEREARRRARDLRLG